MCYLLETKLMMQASDGVVLTLSSIDSKLEEKENESRLRRYATMLTLG